VEREATNPAGGRVRLHHTLRHSLAKGRRGKAERYICILNLFFGHGCLDFLDEGLEGAQRRSVTVVPLYSLAGSANRRFMYNRHSRLLWIKNAFVPYG
jgi:hypothetical protein